MHNETSYENLTLDCPIYANNSEALIDSFKFWVEGVAQTCIAVPGFIGKSRFVTFFNKAGITLSLSPSSLNVILLSAQ